MPLGETGRDVSKVLVRFWDIGWVMGFVFLLFSIPKCVTNILLHVFNM